MTITAAALAALQLALKLRAIAQQNGEWTPEEEAKFRADTEAAFKAPHWQKD